MPRRHNRVPVRGLPGHRDLGCPMQRNPMCPWLPRRCPPPHDRERRESSRCLRSSGTNVRRAWRGPNRKYQRAPGGRGSIQEQADRGHRSRAGATAQNGRTTSRSERRGDARCGEASHVAFCETSPFMPTVRCRIGLTREVAHREGRWEEAAGIRPRPWPNARRASRVRRAMAANLASGLTATGNPTASSMARSLAESAYATASSSENPCLAA